VNPLQKSPAECRAFPRIFDVRGSPAHHAAHHAANHPAHEGPGPGIAAAAVTTAAVGGRGSAATDRRRTPRTVIAAAGLATIFYVTRPV